MDLSQNLQEDNQEEELKLEEERIEKLNREVELHKQRLKLLKEGISKRKFKFSKDSSAEQSQSHYGSKVGTNSIRNRLSHRDPTED